MAPHAFARPVWREIGIATGISIVLTALVLAAGGVSAGLMGYSGWGPLALGRGDAASSVRLQAQSAAPRAAVPAARATTTHRTRVHAAAAAPRRVHRHHAASTPARAHAARARHRAVAAAPRSVPAPTPVAAAAAPAPAPVAVAPRRVVRAHGNPHTAAKPTGNPHTAAQPTGNPHAVVTVVPTPAPAPPAKVHGRPADVPAGPGANRGHGNGR